MYLSGKKPLPVNSSPPVVEIKLIAAHVIRRLVYPGLLEPVFDVISVSLIDSLEI